MSKIISQLSEDLMQFITDQKIFYVATAPQEGKINLSPKGLDTFRILNPETVCWLNLTGSGNETAAHIIENSRITIMFCAYEGKPLILRLYGAGKVIYRGENSWNKYAPLFPDYLSARQIIVVDLRMVQTSCGFAVPLMEFKGNRDQLSKWADHKGEEGIKDYWKQKNRKSLDGMPTGI